VEARLRIIAVGQQKITSALVCCVELILRDRRNLRLVRGRLGFLFYFLCEPGPDQNSDGQRECGGRNGVLTHLLLPQILKLISTDILKCRADHFNLTGRNPFDKAKTPRAEEPFARTIVAASQQRQSMRRRRRLFGATRGTVRSKIRVPI
jgi:hypothetical protein